MNGHSRWVCSGIGFALWLACAARPMAQERSASGWGNAGAATKAVVTSGWGNVESAAKPAKEPDRPTARTASPSPGSAKAEPPVAPGERIAPVARVKPEAPRAGVARAEGVNAVSAPVRPRAPQPSVGLAWPGEWAEAVSLATIVAPVALPAADSAVSEPARAAAPSSPAPVQPEPAEVAAPAAPVESVAPAPGASQTPVQAPVTPSAPGVKAAVPPVRDDYRRWLEVQTLAASSRYRFVDNSQGVVVNNQMQHSESVKARVKLDAAGHYAISFGLASGSSFTGGWNNAGVGTPNDLFTRVYLKQLFFSAVPAAGIELQYGGITIARGENTEITSYDNDNFIVGERVTIKRPKALYFDEITATRAYLGDLTTPSILDRYQRLDETNYQQVLVAKKLGKRASASFDYTTTAGISTVRSGFTIKTAETRVVDLARVEAYRRLDDPATGYAVYAERALAKRVTAGGGWADIDVAYGGLNADRFNKGRRLFVNGTVTVVPELSVQMFYQHALGNAFALSNRSRLEVLLAYNVLKALQRGGVF